MRFLVREAKSKIVHVFSLVLCVCIFCTLFTLPSAVSSAANGDELTDIKAHWAESVIRKWVSQGLAKGYGNGRFGPNDSITRAEFVTLLNRIFGYSEMSDKSFPDVKAGAWYAGEIAKAYQAGIISGDNKGNMNPETVISRQEAAVILCRAFSLEGDHIDGVLKYADLDQIAQWALNSVGTMTKKGYVTGRPGNLFAPTANLSRAEAVKMIDNVMGEMINVAGTFTRVVPGNMVISSPGVTLKDTYIAGDLYLTEGIGNEPIQLIDVEIKGRTIVADGVDVKSLLTGKHIAEGNTQGQPTPKPTGTPVSSTPTTAPGSSTPSTPDPTTQPTTAPTPTQRPTATPTPSPTQGPTATPTPTPHESTTYYIDYENGNDANDGLTKSTVWKRHPFMQNYSGKYVHSQGDVFVFKGGTVWPSECFSLIIKTGGTQANPDRYTVDKSWYSGDEWTRPVFDMERQVLNENPRPVYITKAENVVFEGFEVKNQRIYGKSAFTWGGITVTDTSNVTVRDCYIHDWYVAEPTVTPDGAFGGVYLAYSPGAILENCVIHGSVVPGIGGYSGVGIRNNGYTTRGCEVYDVPNGFLGNGIVDGNEIHHIYTSYDSGDNVLTPPNGTHANGVYLFGNAVFSNNYIHDILAPGAPVVFPAAGWNKANGTMLIYNNIIRGGLHLNADGMAEGNNATYHIYNNIIQANNSCILASKKNNNPIKNVYIKNNILITTGTYPNPVNFAQDIDNLDVDRNIYYNHKKTNLVDKKDCVLNFMNKRYNMDTSREAGFNLTSILSENPLTIDFIPSSWSDIAVDSGVDLSSFFTDDRLGMLRPQGNGFDIGPYEFTGDVK